MNDCDHVEGVTMDTGDVEFRKNVAQKVFHQITDARIDTLELRAICAAENPDQWLRDAIRLRAVTSNMDEALPISDDQLREAVRRAESSP